MDKYQEGAGQQGLTSGQTNQYMTKYITKLQQQAKSINWILLAFLLLLLHVKLVVKLAAFVLILFTRYRQVSWKTMIQQKQLYFYFALIIIAVINFLSGGDTGLPKITATGFGICLWLLCAGAAVFLYHIVQKEEISVLHRTISLFFILHAIAIFGNLASIMIECGTLNPYTFKGFNQKYYISTGDYIRGITFDSPVTTAIISAFSVLYFLYQRKLALSVASMAGLVLIGSNLTNIFLVLVLLFLFVAKSDRMQKSAIIIQLLVLIVFIGKISPQNNEYTARFAFKMLGLIYDKPKKVVTPDFIRKQPDSLLNERDLKKKTALLYIDSISATKMLSEKQSMTDGVTESELPDKKLLKHVSHPALTGTSSEFRETPAVKEKVNRFSAFLNTTYDGAQKKQLDSGIDLSRPGKWTAFKQIAEFYKSHPARIVLGTGAGNFSSRLAFKTTGLGIAGGYPQKLRYIHPAFRDNHLFLYLYYHAQDQQKHAAENTPDSTYGQLISEYGIVGMLAFLVFYCGYILRFRKRMTYSIGIMLLLSGSFFTEYWFEQLSIVILVELLFFTDIKPAPEKPVAS